jgi:hypothetical protein
VADPEADVAGERMVHERRKEDAGDDRPGPAEARGEHQREQLRAIAHLGHRHARE